MHGYKSNRELLNEYGLHVRGHLDAKKAIINLVHRSKLRYLHKHKYFNDEYDLIEPAKILLIGPSGHGKTFLVETAAKLMNFPLLTFDATMLSPSGRSDGVNQEQLKQAIRDNAAFLQATSSYYHSIEGAIDQTVVYIDEIDKIAKPDGSSNNWSRHVQESFLTLFDDHDGEFSGVSFIFSGAFTGMEFDKEKKSIGFHHTKEEIVDPDLDEAVIKYGLVTELVGRINSIHKLENLEKEDYRDILERYLLPKKRKELVYYNCMTFNLSDTQIDGLISKAQKSGQGVRALKRELNKLAADVEFYHEEVRTDQLALEDLGEQYSNQHKY